MKQTLIVAFLLLIGVLPQGCVVWEIRDELRSANTQLDEVHDSLQQLEKTNELIAQVQTG